MTKDFYMTKRGDVWYVRFRDPISKTILTARSSGETNKTAAEKWARKILPQIGKPDLTLKEWAAPFYGEKCPHVSRLKLEGKTFNDHSILNNASYVRNFIVTDSMAGKKLSDLTRSDILAFRDRLVAKVGRSRTSQKIMSVLKVIIREALYREYLQRDLFTGIGLIYYEKKPRKALSKADLKALLDPAKYKNPLHYEATLCAAWTGMRAGEIRALTWGALDGKIIHVDWAIPTDGGDKTLPKWGKRRVCPYPAALSEVLELRRGDAGAWVFPASDGGKTINAPMGYKHWAAAVKRAAGKTGASLHVLRHTLNSMLRESGVSDELLQGSFGWSGIEMQDNYTHRDGYDYSAQATMIDKLKGALDESN